MPAAVIAALIGAAVTGTTTGLELSGVGQPNQDALKRDQAKQLEAANLKSRQDQELATQQAARRASPDVQSQTGGNLGTQSFAAQVASATGNPGDVSLIQRTLFQGGGEGTPASEPSLTGLRPNGGGGGGSGLTPAFEALGGNPASGGRDLSGSSGGNFDISKIMELFKKGGGEGSSGGGFGESSSPEFSFHDALAA